MMVISSGINTGIEGWETENQVRRQNTWNFKQLDFRNRNLEELDFND